MLIQLTAKEIKNDLKEYLKIFVNEIKIPVDQYAKFVTGLKDEELQNAFNDIQPFLFDGEDQSWDLWIKGLNFNSYQYLDGADSVSTAFELVLNCNFLTRTSLEMDRTGKFTTIP